MPPPLVHSILSRRNATSLSPLDVYTVAREAGVSYEAAARQLYHLERITQHELRELLKGEADKGETGDWCRTPTRPPASRTFGRLTWLGATNNSMSGTDDEIIISLPEDRSTGYRWSIPSASPSPRRSATQPPPPFSDAGLPGSAELAMVESKAEPLRRPPSQAVDRARQPAPTAKPEPLPIADGRATVVGDVYIADGAPQVMTDAAIRSRRLARLGASEAQKAVQQVRNEKIVAGAVGRRVFGIRLEEPGKTELRLVLRNEYSDADPVDEYRITAAVEARREAFTIDQISDGDDDWADGARDRRRSTVAASVDEHR